MPQTEHERVTETITSRIDDGTYPPDSKLPSISQLANELKVSPGTVKNVQMVLKDRRVLVGRPGKGVYVAAKPPSPSQ